MKFGNNEKTNFNISRKMKDESSYSLNKSATSDNLNSLGDISGEKYFPPEAITNTLNVIVPLMVHEQNFILNIFKVELFKKVGNNGNPETESSKRNSNILESETIDDKKENEPPETNSDEVWNTLDIKLLSKVNEPIKDLRIKKKIYDIMNYIFEEFKNELINIADAGTQYDPTFSIGMMVRLENLLREYKNTDQNYIYSIVEAAFKHLVVVFDSYMERQFKAIDEFKNLRKKPQGILPIINIFPNFIDCLEYNLENNDNETSGIVTITYERTSKKIFECIDALTKDVLNDGEKYDEKDKLNVHILIIENMHYFSIELGDREIKTLRSYILEAKNRYNYHLNVYKKNCYI